MDVLCNEHSAHEVRISGLEQRVDAHGDELDDLKECVVRLTALQAANSKWQETADDRIAALEAAPGRRWESLANYIMTAVVALIIGMLAGQIGLN